MKKQKGGAPAPDAPPPPPPLDPPLGVWLLQCSTQSNEYSYSIDSTVVLRKSTHPYFWLSFLITVT